MDATNIVGVGLYGGSSVVPSASSSSSGEAAAARGASKSGDDSSAASGSTANVTPTAPFFLYVDRSNEPDDDPLSPITPLGSRPNLPGKMHVILSRPDLAPIVSWMPHGRSWKIHDPHRFERSVMPKFWKKCNLTSFYRQVNAWGFLRMNNGEDKNSFYHEYFLRGRPYLCKKMQRAGRTKDAATRRECEPDFYAISEIYPLPEETSSYDLDMLKKTMQVGGPTARMTMHHGSSDGGGDGATEADQAETAQPQKKLKSHHDPVANDVQQNDILPQPSLSPPIMQQPIQQLQHLQHEQHSPRVSPSMPQEPIQQLQLQHVQHSQSSQMLPPQQPQVQQSQPLPQPEPQPSSDTITSSQMGPTTAANSLLQHQQQLTRWQAFLFPFLQMRVGGLNTWSWLTDWWSSRGIVPTFTDEDERTEQQQLSEQEKQAAREDVLGTGNSTACVRELSPEEKYVALQLLKIELDKVPTSSKMEFMEACTRCGELVDDTCLLVFLESEKLDASAAAHRITAYWRLRVGALGHDRAFLPLTIRNIFPKEHIRDLKMGLSQIVPATDLYGRSIILMSPGNLHGKDYSTDVQIRSFFYMYHAVLDRQHEARKGIVIIFTGRNMLPGHVDVNMLTRFLEFLKCVPCSVKAIHWVYFNKPHHRVAFSVGKYFLGRMLRTRTEVHNETNKQLLDRLSQFGMPPERLPAELGGLIKLDHEKWVEDRIAHDL